MTDTPNQPPARDAVVEQCDREAAAEIYRLLGFGPCQHILDGVEDDIGVVQIVARNRCGTRDADLALCIRWAEEVSTLNWDEIVADGGVTAGMVVQQELRTVQLHRLRDAGRQRQLGEDRGRGGVCKAVADGYEAMCAQRGLATPAAHSPDAGKMVAAGEEEDDFLARYDFAGVAQPAVLAALPSTPPAADVGEVARLREALKQAGDDVTRLKGDMGNQGARATYTALSSISLRIRAALRTAKDTPR